MDRSASAQAGEVDVRLERRHMLNEALEHMTAAIEILDKTRASADIGARLDEAMHRLRDEISQIT